MGNAYWYVAPLQTDDPRMAGVPAELWVIPTPWVRVLPDAREFVAGYEVAAPGVPVERFTPDEIVHLRYPNPLDPHYGLSPLQTNALAVDANTELQKSRYQTFLAGPRPGVVLQTDQTLADQTVKRLEDRLESKFAGRQNWHRPMVLEQGLKPTGLRVEEWDLLEYSAVPIPENPGALTVALQKGLVRDGTLRDWLAQVSDDRGGKCWAVGDVLTELVRAKVVHSE